MNAMHCRCLLCPHEQTCLPASPPPEKLATPKFVNAGTMREIENVKAGFAGITNALATPPKKWAASEKALAQPSWGISEAEIP